MSLLYKMAYRIFRCFMLMYVLLNNKTSCCPIFLLKFFFIKVSHKRFYCGNTNTRIQYDISPRQVSGDFVLQDCILHWQTTELYSRWGTPSGPGSPSGSKHLGLKGGPLVPGQEPGLKGDLQFRWVTLTGTKGAS